MRKSNGGFSMVEMLVVVTIILVMVTGSISILGVFMRGQGIKQAGRVISGQFMNARQMRAPRSVSTSSSSTRPSRFFACIGTTIRMDRRDRRLTIGPSS